MEDKKGLNLGKPTDDNGVLKNAKGAVPLKYLSNF